MNNRGSLSFFGSDNLRQTIEQFYKWFNYTYEHAPVNFASFTGLHHPSIARLQGNMLTGRALKYFEEDGSGFIKEVEKLAELAKHDTNGRSQCSIFTKSVLYISKPEDIVQILLFNKQYIDRGLLAFNKIFGNHNLVSLPSNDEWKQKRTQLIEWVLKADALTELAPIMQEIIDEKLNKVMEKNNGQVPSLELFFVNLTMDIFARSRMGTNSLDDKTDTLAKALDHSLALAAQPDSGALSKLADTKLGAIFAYCNKKLDAKLYNQHDHLMTTLKEHLLKPNLESIRTSKNILREYFDQYPDDDEAAMNNAAEDASVYLLAGHETTARLLQFTLILLAKHPNVLVKLRNEIDENIPDNGQWTRNDIKKLNYLTKIIKETLRLFPSTPVIPRAVKEPFVLAKIPMCRNSAEYEKAMAERDPTEDIVLPEGSRVIISPWFTHRMESLFENPEEFIPERHQSTSIDYGADNISWIPFGLGDRSCPGRHFAVQEAMITLAEIVSKYDFNVKPAFKDVNLLEPLFIANVVHKWVAIVEFTPRQLQNDNEYVPSMSAM